MCEGPWREYAEQLGSDEFRPVAGPRVLDNAIVLDDRFALLGQPAPRFAALNQATARWVALVFFPEAGSATCSTQLGGLQAQLGALTAAGVTLLGVSPDDDVRQRTMAETLGLGFPLCSDASGQLARAYQAVAGGRFRRSTVLVGPERRIDHVLVAPEPATHAAQILDAVRRFEAPPRPLARGQELVVLRRPKRAQEVAEALGLTPDHEEFTG
jgi:peroxiredoxin Q/BCP